MHENTKIGPVLDVATSFLHGKYRVEIRFWSSNRDNTHCWVRISHGSNKFEMDLNNSTEIPEDQLEEFAIQLNAKDFVCRSKANAKPQRRELAGRLFTKNRSHGKKKLDWYWTRDTFYSLSENDVSNKNDSSSSSLTESTSRRRWSGSFLVNRKIFRIHSHNLFIGLTIDGKHVWQQQEEQKGDTSIAPMIRDTCLFPLFKDIQDAILLIFHCRTMLLFRANSSNIFTILYVCSIFILSSTLD